MSLRNIKLYGHLGKRFGKLHRMDVKNPAEAVAALRANFPDFEKEIMRKSQPGYHVLVGDRDLNGAQLADPCGKGDIKIIPVVQGAKKGGVLQSIIGITLIIVGTFVPGMQFLVPAGISMLASGVVQLLTSSPSRKSTEKPENTPSYGFNGPVNTTTQGNPVPVCYGEMIVGSQVASFGMSIESVFVPPAYNAGDASAGGGYGQDGLPQDGFAQMLVADTSITGRPQSWDYNGEYAMQIEFGPSGTALRHNWNYTLRRNLVGTGSENVILDVPYDEYTRGFSIDLNAYPAFADLVAGNTLWVERGSKGSLPKWDTGPAYSPDYNPA